MLRSRIIPCLLVHDRGLVKTVRFGDPKYVGDPINAVRIFNEKEVDELMVLDIDASAQGREPDFGLIEKLAQECRMPLSYGGGISSPAHGERIIGLGVEKLAISSAAIRNPRLVSELANAVGSQSVSVVIDVKKSLFGKYSVVTINGTQKVSDSVWDLVKRAESAGAGEIVINAIDRDGTMQGYDTNLADHVRGLVDVPLTILGGGGSLEDIRDLITRFGTIGAAAGSLFVFKGKYRAVLISYPTPEQKKLCLTKGVAVATA